MTFSTPERGRHAGVVRGGTSRKMNPILQPGAQVDVSWRARLEEHIGSFTVEPLRSRAAALSDRMALAGLNAVTGLLGFSLPEREPHGDLYLKTERLLDLLGQNDIWPLAYLRWELALLEELGFGLDLSECAVTGGRDDLVYVSPRSGRAVSRQGAGEWAESPVAAAASVAGAGRCAGSRGPSGAWHNRILHGEQACARVGTQAPARGAGPVDGPVQPPSCAAVNTILRPLIVAQDHHVAAYFDKAHPGQCAKIGALGLKVGAGHLGAADGAEFDPRVRRGLLGGKAVAGGLPGHLAILVKPDRGAGGEGGAVQFGQLPEAITAIFR